MLKNTTTRTLEAAVKIMRDYTKAEPGAAWSMGPSIYYYALLPLIGQYLSLMHNPGKATILPDFEPLMQELGEQQFSLRLLAALMEAPTEIPALYPDSLKDLRGPISQVGLKAWTLVITPQDSATDQTPSIRAFVTVSLRSRSYEISGGSEPRPFKDQAFFPRTFCTALANQQISGKAPMPSYIKFEGGDSAWHQCLISSMATS